MPKCSFAKWTPISGAVGPYISGPFKIVHHTTEGSKATDAFTAYKNHKSDPHFTVQNDMIYQHIDTSLSARSLKNAPGGVQTNKDGAIQIEVVGFAHLKKDAKTLASVARLCRWIEKAHSVPRAWPNGLPKTATPAGKDPGGHNRNATNWNTKGGHFGHSQVPENDHWDPGYTPSEVNFLMEAEFDTKGTLVHEKLMKESYREVLTDSVAATEKASKTTAETTTMPDHQDMKRSGDSYEDY